MVFRGAALAVTVALNLAATLTVSAMSAMALTVPLAVIEVRTSGVAVALPYQGGEGGGGVGKQRCWGVVLNHTAAAAQEEKGVMHRSADTS
jgi:hypothetical protein